MGKYNNLQRSSLYKKELLLISGFFILFAILFFLLFKYIFPIIIVSYDYKTADVIAIIAVLATIASILAMIAKYIHEKLIATKKGVNIEIKVEEDTVIIKCIIENNGRKRIVPRIIYAFIESSSYNTESGLHEFPFLLKYEKGECECMLSKFCQKGELKSYPLELIDEGKHSSYRKVFKFRQLSHESILFIDPGETFNDNIAITLNSGVYRVIVVAMFVNESCMCATENFIIKREQKL